MANRIVDGSWISLKTRETSKCYSSKDKMEANEDGETTVKIDGETTVKVTEGMATLREIIQKLKSLQVEMASKDDIESVKSLLSEQQMKISQLNDKISVLESAVAALKHGLRRKEDFSCSTPLPISVISREESDEDSDDGPMMFCSF